MLAVDQRHVAQAFAFRSSGFCGTFTERPSYFFVMRAKKMTNVRAVRYRRLAFQESDKATAELLNLLAEEAERGVLVTSDGLWRSRPENTGSHYEAIFRQGTDANRYIGS
jgi:hypothetical protein